MILLSKIHYKANHQQALQPVGDAPGISVGGH